MCVIVAVSSSPSASAATRTVTVFGTLQFVRVKVSDDGETVTPHPEQAVTDGLTTTFPDGWEASATVYVSVTGAFASLMASAVAESVTPPTTLTVNWSVSASPSVSRARSVTRAPEEGVSAVGAPESWRVWKFSERPAGRADAV